MDPYERKRDKLLQLFDEANEDDIYHGSSDESETESEADPFSDDGEFGGDPDYNPEDDDVDSDDDLNFHYEAHVEVQRELETENLEPETENLEPGSEYLDEAETDSWHSDVRDIPNFAFDDSETGVKKDINKECSPRDIFEKLFTKDIVKMLVDCTNAYGKKLCETNRPKTRGSRMLNFTETDEKEMLKFLGLCLLQGQIDFPSLRLLFSNHPLYYHPVFSYVMTGRRFEQMLRCLNTYYTSPHEEQKNSRKLQKIRPMLEAVLKNIQSAFLPYKNLSLDESLLLFKGRLTFKQYLKGKRSKFGIKLYELTASDGYVLNIEIYQGKEVNIEKSGKTDAIVLRLMKPYLNKGHHLFMDNFYNSVPLSEELLNCRTHTTGTLRANRKYNPKEITSANLKKGDHVWKRKRQVYVSKWKDKRDVLTISTAHHPELVEVANRYGKTVFKPNIVADYNDNMSGIDRSDQMISYYSSPRKTIRWHKKVLFHLLDICVWNSYYLYKKFHPKVTFLQFRDELITSLIDLPSNLSNGRDLVSLVPSRGRPRKAAASTSASATSIDQHFLEKIPPPIGFKRKSYFQRCRVCSAQKIRKETSYRCKTCPDKPPMCQGCFEPYHKQK